jgi:ABC-type multidrug transport system fused ATPase/permease subunit
MQWIRTTQSERIQDFMTGLIHDQALSVDLSYYDSPAYYDRLHRARVDARSRPLQLLEGLGSLGRNSITMAGMAVLLISYSPWILLPLLVGTLPALGVTLLYAVRFNEWRLRNTSEERRCNYFDWLLTMREAAPEIRLFDLGRHYREAYQLLRGRLRGERIALEQRQLIAELIAGSLALVATALAMLWMILRTADRMAELCPERVEISRLGAQPATHDGITQIPGSYEKTLRGARLLIERGISVQIKTAWMKDNIVEAAEIQAMVKEMGASSRRSSRYEARNSVRGSSSRPRSAYSIALFFVSARYRSRLAFHRASPLPSRARVLAFSSISGELLVAIART